MEEFGTFGDHVKLSAIAFMLIVTGTLRMVHLMPLHPKTL